MSSGRDQDGGSGDASRRGFLGKGASLAMTGGLVTSYGTLAAMSGRFLYPAGDTPKGWMFVARADELAVGGSMVYRLPSGAPVTVARQGGGTEAADFVALSSTCPHLGCQVHWEGANNRFFCPCHNGVFDPTGKAIAGPPGEAGQSLGRYALKVERELLYIEVELEVLALGDGSLEEHVVHRGPGHDPCLATPSRKA